MNRRIFVAAGIAALAMGVAGGAAHAADKLIAGVVFQQDQFFNGIELGMKAAASKAGGIELLLANTEGRPEKEASLVDTYISRGVKAIVISPISPKGSIPALKRASDAGVKVIA